MAHHPGTSRQSALTTWDALVAVVLALVGAAWLASLTTSGDGATPVLVRAASVAALGVPLVLVAVPVALLILRPQDRRTRRPLLDTALVAASVAAVTLAAGHQVQQAMTGAQPGARLLPVLGLMSDALVLLVALVPTAVLLYAVPRLRLRALTRPALFGSAALIAVAVPMGQLAAGAPSAAAAPTSRTAACLAGIGVNKTFDVTAMNVNIPVNRFGDHDPDGKMYVLTSRIPAVLAQQSSQQVSIGLRDDAIQPLVIRANEGDCVEITYTNRATGGSFGLHIDGLEFSLDSSGDLVGDNNDSSNPFGATSTYRFAIPVDPTLDGGHYIHPGPGYRAAVDHGLFGALMVEPVGSTYWNANTPNTPLESGWEATIKPGGPSATCVKRSSIPTCAFREVALLHHEIGNDNETLTDKFGNEIPLQDDTTGSYKPGGFALNYRSEPFRNRLLTFPKEKAHSYSSYTFGEPSTPLVRGYLADPTIIRLMHVGAEKFHIFHLHGGGDRWRYNPVADNTFDYSETGLEKDPPVALSASQRLDSQSIGPGESYNLEIEGGAGGVQQSSGDFLFHCHIAKHYVSGMWGLWRVFSTLQPDFPPLADRVAPPAGVVSSALVGRTYNGTKITTKNLDGWIRPQLPPQGIPQTGQDATVWDWKVAGTSTKPVYLGAPADPTVYPDSPNGLPGQPNLLAVDAGHVVSGRPAILFNPVNGRPAYPMFRPHIGQRPPFTGNGHTGTPYLGNNAAAPKAATTDPYAGRVDGLCPANRPLRTFNVVAIAMAIKRTPTVTDPEGKIFVLAHDKATTYADPAKGVPLAIRANQGDCIGVTLTNEIPDASAFDGFSKATMHIHHVQFDVQGSDGVSAGFAYEHSVRPYQVTDPTLVTKVAKGATVLTLTDVAKFIGKDANGNATKPFIAVGEGTESIDIHQIKSVNAKAKTVTLVTPLDKPHAAGEFAGSEFIQYRWYPDVLLDNIFWHDHVDGIHGWGHGLVGQLIVEPKGSTYHDPRTGAEVDSGTLVDIRTTSPLVPGLVNGSFRELALWTIDDNDKGDYSTLNLRANPLADRPDKANQFSSYTYGDPVTPLPLLYPNDPLVVRTINVAPSIDTLHLQGGRTLLEPRYAPHDGGTGTQVNGPTIIDAVHYSVSEKFTLVFNGSRPDMTMRPGDYLYANGNERRTQDGAWGIVRILPGTVPDLQPLPGVAAPTSSYTLPSVTGGLPPATTDPGNPCPAGSPARRFDVTALDKKTGQQGGRMAFVPNSDVPSVLAGTKEKSPLVLHVVAGECVTVNVTNTLGDPVGFSVAKLDRTDGSGGVNVGFSSDQNVAPGGTRQYVYYVPSDRIGVATISDLAGSGQTMKRGLYGAVVVAPASRVAGESTSFSDPATGAERNVGPQVLVHVPGGEVPDYRDFTVVMADDDPRIGQDFMPYPTDATPGKSLINYQAAPVGDGDGAFQNPGAVPILQAFAGDPMQVHVVMAPGSENAHVLSLGGLRWHVDPFIDNSNTVSAQGIGPWETFSADIVGGAGGTAAEEGDYFYGDQRRPFTQAGMWGLQRVLPAGMSGACPIKLVDGSAC
jgi:FtsP/CotA-like multicopper oxidase with cupredoxin domain